MAGTVIHFADIVADENRVAVHPYEKNSGIVKTSLVFGRSQAIEAFIKSTVAELATIHLACGLYSAGHMVTQSLDRLYYHLNYLIPPQRLDRKEITHGCFRDGLMRLVRTDVMNGVIYNGTVRQLTTSDTLALLGKDEYSRGAFTIIPSPTLIQDLTGSSYTAKDLRNAQIQTAINDSDLDQLEAVFNWE
ncbi:MAG TPA: hypothetical protein VK158_06825 [Acidobacteriota bacterium]|nr:hypothetical protein [Acidobacteriota bacterium]